MSNVTKMILNLQITPNNGSFAAELLVRSYENPKGKGVGVCGWTVDLNEGAGFVTDEEEGTYERPVLTKTYHTLVSNDSEGHVWFTVLGTDYRFSLTHPESKWRSTGVFARDIDDVKHQFNRGAAPVDVDFG